MPRILLVDDNADILDLFGRELRKSHDVLIADHGEVALRIIAEQSEVIDLAVLDYMMPGVDGLTVASELVTHGVPFIFVTASRASMFQDEATRTGALAILFKPVHLEQLSRTVDDALRIDARDRMRLSREQRAAMVNQAVGLVMGLNYCMTTQAAYSAIRHHARSKSVSMLDIAQRIVESIEFVRSFKELP